MRERFKLNGTSMRGATCSVVILLLIATASAQSGRRAREIQVPVPPSPVEETKPAAPSKPAEDDRLPAVAEKNQDYACSADGTLTRILSDDTGDEQIFTSKQVDVRVTIISKPAPGYTKEARRLGVQGYVTLRALLSGNGKVTRVRMRRGLSAGLTENAIRAACKIKFKPAMKDGQTVSQWVILEYVFRLADSSIFWP